MQEQRPQCPQCPLVVRRGQPDPLEGDMDWANRGEKKFGGGVLSSDEIFPGLDFGSLLFFFFSSSFLSSFLDITFIHLQTQTTKSHYKQLSRESPDKIITKPRREYAFGRR